MSTRLGRIAMLLAALAFAGTTVASAQAVELYGAWSSIGGSSDFDDVESGIGGGATVLFNAGAVMVGVGGSYLTYGIAGIDENFKNINLTGEVRYVVYRGMKFKVYVAGRGGYARASFDAGGSDASASGFSYGGELGGMLPLGQGKVSLVGAFHVGQVSLGEFEVDGNATGFDPDNGTVIGARVGVNIGFGSN